MTAAAPNDRLSEGRHEVGRRRRGTGHRAVSRTVTLLLAAGFAVVGCSFEVTRRELWPAGRRMGALYSVSGPPRIVLVGCKADDYTQRTVVFARKLGRR